MFLTGEWNVYVYTHTTAIIKAIKYQQEARIKSCIKLSKIMQFNVTTVLYNMTKKTSAAHVQCIMWSSSIQIFIIVRYFVHFNVHATNHTWSRIAHTHWRSTHTHVKNYHNRFLFNCILKPLYMCVIYRTFTQLNWTKIRSS